MSVPLLSSNFVVGVFDMLHIGHIQLLTEHKQGSHLYIGVLSDALAETLLGATPVMPQSERVELVAALSLVDGAEIVISTDLRSLISHPGNSSVSLEAGLPVSAFNAGSLRIHPSATLSQSSSRLLSAGLSVRGSARAHSRFGPGE